MTSERRFALAALLLASGCAGGPRPFLRRAPLLRDPDQQPFSVPCRDEGEGKEKQHVCAPELYVSPLAWDALDNSLFYPLGRGLALDPAGEAQNVNALDETPDSSWFTNRPAAWFDDLERFQRGACTADEVLDPASDAPGSWKIDKGKQDGSTPGFRVRVRGKKYMVKVDANEKTPSAAVIGAILHHAVGYNTSCEQLLHVDPSLLELEPGLTVTDNSGVARPFDRAALAKVLALATQPDGKVRVQASAWLSGRMLGPFSYLGTRSGDFNDVVPHEDRRELRGLRVLASLIEHIDAREQNSMDAWVAADPSRPDSSPGYVRHYVMDFSDALGATWEWDDISRRLGHSYLLDFEDVARDIVTLGIPLRRWDTVRLEPGQEMFSYYRADDFDPAGWKNEYPNPAFSRASERDNAWMARLLARLEPEHLDALVDVAEFEPQHANYFRHVLGERLRRILERYLTRLSPLGDASVQGGRLCLTDWSRRRGLRSPSSYRYRATLDGGSTSLRTTIDESSRLCVELPASTKTETTVITLDNGQAAALEVHLDSPGGSFRLLGLERRTPD